MLLCAGNNGSNGFDTATNTASGTNPGGIFSFENYCGPAPDPAGNSAFLRIAENQSGGNAGNTAYGSDLLDRHALGRDRRRRRLHPRAQRSFNDGWRGRFWAEDFGGGGHNILMQGSGVANGSLGGIGWATTSTFASHLWPFGGYGDYRRFIFEMTCFRPAGCDRAGWNAVDANTIHPDPRRPPGPDVSFVDGPTRPRRVGARQPGALLARTDQGSGLRFSRLKVDGATRGDGTIDYAGQRRLRHRLDRRPAASSPAASTPAPAAPTSAGTASTPQSIPDGAHGLAICLQDYGQYSA